MLFETTTKRSCPICSSTDDSNIIFDERIDVPKIDGMTFSSRKIPEFMNTRLVCCPECDLLYAPQIPNEAELSSAYHNAEYDSTEEANSAGKTYAKWLPQVKKSLSHYDSALDIGTGNGIFLTHLLENGFNEVFGIEPSIEAINSAPEHIKKRIKVGMFNVDDFTPDYFSLISIFQTLEHINAPGEFLNQAYKLLKPGGALMIVAHNYRHWLMRILGKRSPIIDIAHLQLFSPNSLKYGLEQAGFQKVEIHFLTNAYSVYYWFKLLPIPSKIKLKLLDFLRVGLGRKIGSIKIPMRVGNVIAWAQK